MSRLFVQPELLARSRVEIRGRDAHYLTHVLRGRVGDQLVVFDGAGNEADAVVVDVTVRSVALEIEARRVVRDSNPLDLTVLQATLQGEKASWLVEKLTEIGVARILFFSAERSKRTRVSTERLARVAVAAAKQCGRVTLPRLVEVPSLRAALEAEVGDGPWFRVFGRLGDATTLGEFMAGQVSAALSRDSSHRAIVVIGPEGGFSDAEEELLGVHGFTGVKLGPRTLRAESAGLVFASILMHRLGDLS